MVSRATLKIKVLRAKNLRNDKSMGYLAKKSDAYVAVHVGSEVRKTQYKDNTLDPEYNEEFTFTPSADFLDTGFLMIKVFDYDLFKQDDAIGEVAVRFRTLGEGPVVLQLKATTPRGKTTQESHGGGGLTGRDGPAIKGGEVCTGEVHIHVTVERPPNSYTPASFPSARTLASTTRIPQKLTPRSASMLRLPSMPQALAKAQAKIKNGGEPWSIRARGLVGCILVTIGGWFVHKSMFSEDYVVKEGDWLTKIAQKKKKTIGQLCEQNHIINRDLIVPGQRVKLR